MTTLTAPDDYGPEPPGLHDAVALHDEEVNRPFGLTDEDRAVLADMRARFRIEHDAQAAWAMRKARKAAQRIAEVDRIAQAEIDRIQEWALSERGGPERDLGFFETLLTEYALRLREQDPKRKSVVTPYGKVSTTQVGAKVVVDDEESFIAWAEVNLPDAVKTKKTVLVTPIKDAIATLDGLPVTEQGEVIPGISITTPTITAKVTPEGPA